MIEKLKKLTPAQCVHIAKIIDKTGDWHFEDMSQSESKWQGWDVVNKKVDDYIGNYILQIKHSNTINIDFDKRFAVYDSGLFEHNVMEEEMIKIIDYLNSI